MFCYARNVACPCHSLSHFRGLVLDVEVQHFGKAHIGALANMPLENKNATLMMQSNTGKESVSTDQRSFKLGKHLSLIGLAEMTKVAQGVERRADTSDFVPFCATCTERIVVDWKFLTFFFRRAETLLGCHSRFFETSLGLKWYWGQLDVEEK